MNTLVFDTETTDLIKNKLLPLDRQPHIIEFFGLSLDPEGNELGTYHFLFKPPVKLNDDVKRITGIDDTMLVDAPVFAAHAQDIKAIIEKHDEVVAHNLSYDMGVVDFEMKRCGLSVEWPIPTCTVEGTEHLKGFRLNLSALHELLFGEKFEGAHRAENDVRALANCFRQLRSIGEI
jgi:DNA polymerase III epsilon subunit-like protein